MSKQETVLLYKTELFEIELFFTFNCVFVWDRNKWNLLTVWKNVPESEHNIGTGVRTRFNHYTTRTPHLDILHIIIIIQVYETRSSAMPWLISFA